MLFTIKNSLLILNSKPKLKAKTTWIKIWPKIHTGLWKTFFKQMTWSGSNVG